MKVLVTGAGGLLGRAVVLELARRAHETAPFPRAALDVTDGAAVSAVLADVRPDAVIHCAAYTRVDDAEQDGARAFEVNAAGTAQVARSCDAIGARLVYPSTDYVFNGSAAEPYAPDAPPAPLNVYGRSKLAGEVAARAARGALIVRTSWLYGAGGRSFVRSVLDAARAGEPLRVVDDQHGAPTWAGDLARVLVRLLEADAPPATYHATNRGVTTWYGLARETLRLARLSTQLIPVRTEDVPRAAARPRFSVLDCTATETIVGALSSWQDALAAALAEEL